MSDVLLKNRLLALRLSKNMRQKEIANLLGLSLRRYGSYERGERTPDSVAMVELIRRIEAAENGK